MLELISLARSAAVFGRVAALATLAGVLFSSCDSSPPANRHVLVPTDTTTPAMAASQPAPAAPVQMDVNARDAEGRTPLFLATTKGDHEKVAQLLGLGANLEGADEKGATPLMIASAAGDLPLMRAFIEHNAKQDVVDADGRTALQRAILAKQPGAVDLLLGNVAQLEPTTPGQPDLLAMACDTGDAKTIAAILNRTPANLEWNAHTRVALDAALAEDDKDLAHLLLSKHPAAPMLEGRNVPLLAQTIVDDKIDAFRALIAAGADPNTVLPTPADKEFLKQLPENLRDYTKADDGVTVLMIAAGTGKPEIVRALLDAGADRNRMTHRHKMLALYFAVRTDKYNAVQMLLGSGPTPEDLRIEISLKSQRVNLIKAGSSIFQTQCSTGRQGFATKPGKYVITDKDRTHKSSIYKVGMPYFMRLNCLDFGMHEGVVPNYPASHGCIRLPSAAAKKFFSEIPVGTVVMIN